MATRNDNVRAISTRFTRAQDSYRINSSKRRRTLAKLRKELKKTFIMVTLSALFIAALADLLSIVDLGWIVSWIIPGIVLFMARRITGINQGADHVIAYRKQAQRQLKVLRNRLRPALVATRNARLAAGQTNEDLGAQAHSYVMTFIRDTAIAQLLELVPVLDILPIYLGQVCKVIIDQNIAYQKAMKLIPKYEQALGSIDQLERFEVAFLAQQLELALQKYEQSEREVEMEEQGEAYSTPFAGAPLGAPA